MNKISFLGPVGSYCNEACNKYTKNKENNKIPARNIKEAIDLLTNDEVDECIVPIENSIRGTVLETLDNLVDNNNLYINYEIVVDISHCLVSNTTIDNIKTIYSHPQALGQCTKYINNTFKDITIQEVESTAKAASIVKDLDNCAAICSRECAKLYNLNIIEEAVQESKNNQTRFVVLSKNKNYKSKGNNKISIMFSLKNKPGELCYILEILNMYQVNMTKIESHPLKTGLGNYWFWVDLDGNLDEENVKKALDTVKDRSLYYKLLGTYKIL